MQRQQIQDIMLVETSTQCGKLCDVFLATDAIEGSGSSLRAGVIKACDMMHLKVEEIFISNKSTYCNIHDLLWHPANKIRGIEKTKI